MGLYESVGEWVRATLPHDRSDPHTVAALAGKQAAELLILYLNWQSRMISSRPRRVLCAPELVNHPLMSERTGALNHILGDIEQGNDLTRYLSRRVRLGFMPPRKLGRKQLGHLQHLDLLLNDWDMHHLHLSTVVESDGFVERGDPLLFAIFRGDAAYLLDVRTHSSFSDDELVRIAVENWPEAELFCELQGLLGNRDGGPTSRDRGELRKAGLMVPIQIDGKVYISRNALSTAGTSAHASRQAAHILSTLRRFEDNMRADPSPFVTMLRKAGGAPDDMPAFNFTMFGHGFGVIETTSGLPVRLE